jgi:hypothetical protein
VKGWKKQLKRCIRSEIIKEASERMKEASERMKEAS